MRPIALATLALALAPVAGTGCTQTHAAPSIEDHYFGMPSAPGGLAAPGSAPLSYRASEVAYDPAVPIRRGPETIAVFVFAHVKDGDWIAPHYRVILVEEEGWADGLEPFQ